MAVEKFVNITEKEIKELGVQALADRPNLKSPYGSGGLGPSQLKAWFDKLAILLAEKINTLQDTFADPEKACKYIAVNDVGREELQTLAQLIASMQTGDFLKNILIIDAQNSIAPNGVYPVDYLQNYLNAMVVEYRKLNADTNDVLAGFATNDVLAGFARSLKLIYDNTTGKLKLSSTLAATVYEKTVDLPLESAIVKIEETTNDDGDAVLRLTLASGTVTDVKINAIFKAELSKKVDKDTYEAGLSQKVDTTDFEKVKQELNTTDIRLTNIEARFSDDSVIDSTVAYEKAVPTNALPYAEVQRVGGMTYKVSPPFSTFLDNGMGLINADGSITDSNPDGAISYRSIPIYSEGLSGKYFALSSECPYITNVKVVLTFVAEDGNVNNVEYPLNTWIPEFDIRNYLAVDAKLTFEIAANTDTFTFTPILTDTDDLVPKLLDTKVTELVSEGANLLDTSTLVPMVNGDVITSIKLDNGKYQSNFTDYYYCKSVTTSLNDLLLQNKGKTFTFSVQPAISNRFVSVVLRGANAQGESILSETKGEVGKTFCTFVVDENLATITRMEIMFNRSSSKFTDTTTVFSDFQINFGGYAQYKPYRADAVDTFPISAELRAFLEPYGYGKGVNGAPNEIDFVDKKFYPRVYIGTIPSSSRWRLSNGIFQAAFTHLGLPLINTNHWTKSLSDEYICTNNYQSRDQVFWTNGAGTLLNIKDTRFSSVEEFNAHLEQNPVSIIYALATPPEPIDISAYLTDDNFIEVEAGGSIKAVNEYEYGAPSTIEYQTEAVE